MTPEQQAGAGTLSREGTFADALSSVRRAQSLVRDALVRTVPEELTPVEARQLTGALGELGKLVAASAVRCSQRAGRDAAAVLALAQGSSMSSAKRGLSLFERTSGATAMGRALRDGTISVEQVAAIAPAAKAAPKVLGDLLDRARSTPLAELREEVARALRRARSEEGQTALERRLHERRFCQLSFPEGGGVRLQAFFGPIQGARVKAALERATSARFRSPPDARLRRGEREEALGDKGATGARPGEARGVTSVPIERLRADALSDLLTGARRVSRGLAAPQVLVRVDAAALRRDAVGDGELCEIAGVGPVSVDAARRLLGEGFFTLLVEDGADIRTVTSTRRAVPRRVRAALELRDQICVVPGCGAADRLEIDHWRNDFAWGGPTELDNLCRLCSTHHAMKTEQGWHLIGGPGKWRWLPPTPIPELAARRTSRARRGDRAVDEVDHRAPHPGVRSGGHTSARAPAQHAAGSRARQTVPTPRAGPLRSGPSEPTPP